jgi:hypothetical protein
MSSVRWLAAVDMTGGDENVAAVAWREKGEKL